MSARDATTPVSPPRRASRLALWAVLAAMTLLAAYSNFFANRFHFDDRHTIVRNPYIRNLRNLPEFFRQASTFTALPVNADYRPMTAASFALDYAWGGGLDPRAFHLTQLLLHAGLAMLCFFLFRRLLQAAGAGASGDFLALFGAALFALHRVNTEPLNYITLRSEILATLGTVGGMLLYLGSPRSRRCGLWLLPMLLGALAKLPAIMLPLLLGSWLALFPADLAFAGETAAPRPRRRWLQLTGAGLAAAGALYGLVRAMAGPHLNFGIISPGVYFQTQLFAWAHYLRLFILPLGLTADADWDPIPHWYDTRVLAGAALTLLLLSAGAYYAHLRPLRGRLFLFGLLWYYFALIPASSLWPSPGLVENHRLYFPMIGLIICVLALACEALAWASAAPRQFPRWLLALAGILLLGAHAAGTHARNRDWRDDMSLWQSSVQANPRNGRAWATLSRLFLERNDFRNARFCMDWADRYAPDYALNAVNHALLDMKEGRMEEAGQRLQEAVAQWPDDAELRGVYSEWLRLNHRPDEAKGRSPMK